ncbi:MAG TPA: glycosyltransferase family 2 protein [Caulobacteraceae bacterium]|jgi:glycosyltransferase involved in cell wall biosynthesis
MTRLSFCIPTFNRGAFIGETLTSLVGQLRPGVEIVIVDGASRDNTASVVSAFAARYPEIRYFREDANSGYDADCDKAVAYAAGDYCWLMTDDDVLAPGAVDRVLEALEGDIDLLIVDAEVRDRSLARRTEPRRLKFTGERVYGPAESDAFLRDAGDALSFVGGTIIRRSLWLSRERRTYYGTLFVHVGVIFQSPFVGRAKVIGEPLVIIRAGNAMWKSKTFEIWTFKWPELIWSFEAYGDGAKGAVTPRDPWRRAKWMFHYRAMGAYSRDEYVRWFGQRKVGAWRPVLWIAAVSPGRLMNFALVCAWVALGRGGRHGCYDLVESSRFSNPASRYVAGLWRGREGAPKLAASR